MKTYNFYISSEPYTIYAEDIRSALSQLKKEVGLKYYDLCKIYFVNNQVRYLRDSFIFSLLEIKGELNG